MFFSGPLCTLIVQYNQQLLFVTCALYYPGMLLLHLYVKLLVLLVLSGETLIGQIYLIVTTVTTVILKNNYFTLSYTSYTVNINDNLLWMLN